jgi:hypothetical protein
VTGGIGSSTFPTTAGALQTTLNGSLDAFVSKLNSDGSGLIYSTYLGGSGQDLGNGIAVDSLGNAYVTGFTTSADFLITAGALQTTMSGTQGAFVSKLNSAGSALIYSTYLGGNDVGYGIAIDSSGNAYVTGSAIATDFPTTPGALQTTYGGGLSDGFVSKLNSNGTALVYSTYLGGSVTDYAYGIAVDSVRNAYVVGTTISTSPVGQIDAFVTKLNTGGSALGYSTYMGGIIDSDTTGRSIAVDSSSQAYVTGYTDAPDFPVTADAVQTSFNNGFDDVFVSKLNSAGSALLYSTYLGGDEGGGDDFADSEGFGIAVDSSNNAYTTGSTTATNFPTTAGALQPGYEGDVRVSDSDAFVSDINTSLFGSLAGAQLQLQRSIGLFTLTAGFVLGTGSDGIDPLTEAVTVQIGSYVASIPASSFTQATTGTYVFGGKVGGSSVLLRLVKAPDGNSFNFLARIPAGSIKGITNPVKVTLTVGDDAATGGVSVWHT